MKKSILKSTALVLCAGLVCCLLLTAAIFDAKTTQQTETQLRSLATALGSAYDANGDADAQASQFSRQIGGLRVTVIAKDGTVLGDSAADYKTMENHAGREELKAAEGAGVGISVRPSETLGTRLMYAAVRTQGGEYIRVAMQYNGFLRDLVSLLPALLGAGLVAFAVAAFVATRVAKTVTDPISDFTESLKNVQEGGARLEPEKYPYEELQAMAGDINRMSEEIARNMRRLEREKAKIDYILDNMNEGKASKAAGKALLEKCKEGIIEGCTCEACTLAADILSKKEYLAKKSMWIFGGDGWAYDIGYGGLDHVIASKKDVNIFVFDTEVYSNTGGQASKASNIGQVAQFAAAGKEVKKKSLAEIAMQYGYVYVAQVAMGANPAQTLKAITEAEAYHGPSLIIGYSPCEMHSIKGGMMNCQKEMKKAVDCGYWNLFRFNPAAEKKFTLDSKAPAGGYHDFLMNEARYSRLTREFPDRAENLFARNEAEAKARYDHLLKLIEMYDD